MKILLATHNHFKMLEFKNILKDKKINIELINLKDLKDFDEVIEGNDSFYENAFIKAKYYSDKYNMSVISDDSGLVVEELNGAPGVLSSRYAGKNSNDNDNLTKLLFDMKDKTNRKAFFICVLCYIDENKNIHYFEGKLHGNISYDFHGKNGFGYDPIFLIDNNRTLADLNETEKNMISHRFNAINEFVSYINMK